MKTIKRTLLWICAVIVVVVVGVPTAYYAVDTANDYNNFKKAVTSLHGMKPDESREEILYGMGKPDYVRKDDDAPRIEADALPSGASINDYMQWEWLPKNDHPNNLAVDFDKSGDKVSMVTCFENQYMPACQTIGGIMSTIGRGNENFIEERLGPPDETKLYREVDGSERKLLVYNDLGLYFMMKARYVSGISKGSAEPSFFWWYRHSRSW